MTSSDKLKKSTWLQLSDTYAPEFFVPKTVNEFLNHLSQNALVIGNGSNAMIGRMDIPIVSTTALDKIECHQDHVIAEAGAMPLKILSACIERWQGGFEFMSTIPGTIGGMAMMNAGAHGDCMANHIRWVEVFDRVAQQKRILDRKEIHFEYRKSDIPGIITRVALSTRRIDPTYSKNTIARMIDYINSAQPRTMTLGSTFKNPDTIPAWKLIDSLDEADIRSEHFHFSSMHRNFLINDGAGGFDEACALIRHVRAKILAKHAINLDVEIHAYKRLDKLII